VVFNVTTKREVRQTFKEETLQCTALSLKAFTYQSFSSNVALLPVFSADSRFYKEPNEEVNLIALSERSASVSHSPTPTVVYINKHFIFCFRNNERTSNLHLKVSKSNKR
jgi:hypothetical protein